MGKWDAQQYRDWRARRRAAGGCTRCERPAEPGRSKCRGCARLHAADALLSYHRRRGREPAGARAAGKAAFAADRDARLAGYEARAAAGLPLFQDAPPGEGGGG